MFVSISDMKNNVTKIKLMYNIMWHKIEKNTDKKHTWNLSKKITKVNHIVEVCVHNFIFNLMHQPKGIKQNKFNYLHIKYLKNTHTQHTNI